MAKLYTNGIFHLEQNPLINNSKKNPDSLPPQSSDIPNNKFLVLTFRAKIFVICKKIQKVMRLSWFSFFALLITSCNNIQQPSNVQEGRNVSINITAVNIEGISVNNNIK